MGIANVITDTIIADFLGPTIERLGKQLGRNIHLDVGLKVDEDVVRRQVISTPRAGFDDLAGEVRIVASDTAIADRYKYHLQCIFEEQPNLEGFSGIRMNGAIRINDADSENDYSGFLYSYNEWDWGKKLRNF